MALSSQPLLFERSHPSKVSFGARIFGKGRIAMMLSLSIFMLIAYLFLLVDAKPYNGPTLVNFTNIFHNEITLKSLEPVATHLGHIPPETLLSDFSEPSTCSVGATKRGHHQNVISFSFYGSTSDKRDYFSGIAVNAELMIKLYPNWVMRVYHDITDNGENKALKDLVDKYGQVLDLCFVGDLPRHGNLLGAQQNMWRFLTLADPLVDATIFRDLDSNLSQREAEAVKEWLNSSYPMHVMRDNPFHKVPMLAGMWGANLINQRSLWSKALKKMLIQGKKAGVKGLDQAALAKFVWTLTKRRGMVMQHDSYFCKSDRYTPAGGMRPFPTCRIETKGSNFVGARRTIDKEPVSKKCPKECRVEKSCDFC